MPTLDQAFSQGNVRRAWRWICSNPNAQWKSYFRRLYRQFAIADESLLTDLADRLRRGLYEPEHACKLFFPKASGVVRPYSLLTVEDQVVYQALVNVVAEKLYPRVRKRYVRETYGNMYAGKSSPWFYRKWQDGYAAFNSAARKAFSDGFRVTAHFDLTAFYDSICHGVLTHFLLLIGCDDSFCKTLTKFLSRWTATQSRIYQHHGIPQGPLSSGLLAEVVLQHFDANHGSNSTVRYFRYVDDIKLFARSEKDLQRVLTRLDLLSKDVGLFPQTGKIGIHTVTDIEAELKIISAPFEFLEQEEEETAVDQVRLRQRILELCPRGLVSNKTEFKSLLAFAGPSSRLNSRLWRVLERHPELHEPVLRYFKRYSKLPLGIANRLLERLKLGPLYAAEVAELVRTAEGRVGRRHEIAIDSYVKESWRPRLWRSARAPTDMIAAIGRWAVRRQLLPFEQVEFAALKMREWWVRGEIIAAVSCASYGAPSYNALLARALNDRIADVAVSAAAHFVEPNGPMPAFDRIRKNRIASHVLKALGVSTRHGEAICGIAVSLERIVGRQLPTIEWGSIFGKRYANVERHAIWTRALSDTDVTAWVNAMDVFDDWLLIALYGHDRSLGTYE